jgi:hypothetical protein
MKLHKHPKTLIKCRKQPADAVSRSNKLRATKTLPTLHTHISFGILSLWEVGVDKPLSPTRKLCLLCSLGPLLRCQIGYRTWPEKVNSVFSAPCCIFTEPKPLKPGLRSRSRSRGVGVGVGRNSRWSRNRKEF